MRRLAFDLSTEQTETAYPSAVSVFLLSVAITVIFFATPFSVT